MNSAGNTAFSARLGDNRGFTMIEMAIVLVIIGIILGAVMKGQDLIKGAQVKEVANGFVGKWQTIANTYYDKTGRNLTDGSAAGGTAATTPNGFMDGILLSTGTLQSTLATATRNAGIDPCTLVKSSLTVSGSGACGTDGLDIGQTTVDGQYLKQTVTAGFYNYKLSLNGSTVTKNVLVLQNVPADVAEGIDKVYDGVSDGTAGSVVNLAACAATSVAAPTNGTGTTVTPAAYSGASAGNMCTIGIILEH